MGLARGKGAASPNAGVLEVLGDRAEPGPGEAPRMEEKCGCGSSSTAPPCLLGGRWGILLLTTVKFYLVGGGSPGKKGNQTKKENNKPRINNCNLGSKCPLASWGDSEGFSYPQVPDFSLPLPNTPTTGQEAQALRRMGSWSCLFVSLGPRESLQSLN